MLISDLKGDYHYTAGKEYIVIQDASSHSEKIPINFASSGQQEVLWLLTEMIDEISDKVNEKYTELFYLLSE